MVHAPRNESFYPFGITMLNEHTDSAWISRVVVQIHTEILSGCTPNKEGIFFLSQVGREDMGTNTYRTSVLFTLWFVYTLSAISPWHGTTIEYTAPLVRM
jgi:hypothetical protein